MTSNQELPALIATNLRKARISCGKPQQEIGNLLGVTFQQIQKYEKNLSRISAASLKRIADFTGKPITYFYNIQENNETVPYGSKKSYNLLQALSNIKDERIRKSLENLIIKLGKEKA